jgi:hypothetical protein
MTEEQSEGEELAEEPQPFQEFHAVNGESAEQAARSKGLIILFVGRDKSDLYCRNLVYYAFPEETARKLLDCSVGLERESIFVEEEQKIIQYLLVRRWLFRTIIDDVAYLYGLNYKTASVLKRQLKG